eukprot:260484_1
MTALELKDQSELSEQLLNDTKEENSSNNENPHAVKVPNGCAAICFKPVCLPSCSICFILAAIITSSILILQNRVTQFASFWVEWRYIDDFYLSQIYTTYNGTRIDYNNKTLLNSTIFKTNSIDKGIILYEYLEMHIHLDTTQVINEFRLKIEPTNQSIAEKLANSISVSTEIWYEYPYYFQFRGQYLEFDSSNDYNDYNGTKTVSALSQPKDCNVAVVIGYGTSGCFRSNKFTIKIKNHQTDITNYYLTHVSLHTHRSQLFKAENAIFLVIFSILLLHNLIQWTKVKCIIGTQVFKKQHSIKYKTLILSIATILYMILITGIPLLIADKWWFTQPQYYSLKLIAVAVSIYLCFLTSSTILWTFFTMSWAFIRIQEQVKFRGNRLCFNCCTCCAICTFAILLIFGISAIYTDLSIRIINIIASVFSWVAIAQVLGYGWNIAKNYMNAYSQLEVKDPAKMFSETSLNFHMWKLHKTTISNVVLLACFMLMTSGFWLQTFIMLESDVALLCYYYTSVAVYCTINAYVHYIRIPKHYKCITCGFSKKSSVDRCKVCSYTMNQIDNKMILQQDEKDEEFNLMKVSINSDVSVTVSEELYDKQLLDQCQNMKCNVNCASFMRIKELTDLYLNQSMTNFVAIFAGLTDYSWIALMNDYVHLLENHNIETVNKTVGSCVEENNCIIEKSTFNENQLEKLLISTMKQIHCYLYHNIHRRQEHTSISNTRQKRYCNETRKKCNVTIDTDEKKEESKQIEEKSNETQEQNQTFPSCICGEILSKDSPSIFGDLDDGVNILCNVCKKPIDQDKFLYHCKHTQNESKHPNGFGLCEHCGVSVIKMNKMEQHDDEFEEYKYNEYKFGSFIYYDLLKSRYPTFKQELLDNGMYNIDIEVWNAIFEKAQEIINIEYAKQLIHKQNDSVISIPHLISIICYTDQSVLCNTFRKSFTKSSNSETDKDVLQKHCNNYYHFGKWLNDTITNYGCLVSSYNKALYHGLKGKFLFESLCTDFNIPTSTTTDIVVASRFAGNQNDDGIILKFKSKWKSQSMWNKATCLPVQWISHYSNEREVVFFGNFNQLLVENIIFTSAISNETNHNLKDMFHAIYLWEMICDGYIAHANVECENNIFSILMTLIELQTLHALYGNKTVISNHFVHTLGLEIPYYIIRLFDYICTKRKQFSLLGIMYLVIVLGTNNEVDKFVGKFFCSVNDADIIKNIRCKQCNQDLCKSNFAEQKICCGCKSNPKNAAGFACKIKILCGYCLCQTCAEMIVNIKTVLPNASHQFDVAPMDDIKGNALKIDLLKSKGLW